MNGEVQQLVDAGRLTKAEAARLELLPPGTCVLHKSWGPGRIVEWDLMGDRLVIDFEGKAGHALKLAFAVSSLEILPAEHLLARHLSDPDAVKAMSAVQLVELALRSSGNKLTMNALEAMLKPRVIAESAYKGWWESAKKQLKSARHVVLPVKRQDPIVLRESSSSPSEQMVGDFVAARDLASKVSMLAAVLRDLELFTQPATELAPLLDDLSKQVNRAHRSSKDALQLVLMREELLSRVPDLQLPAEQVSVAEVLVRCGDQLREMANALPASLTTALYRAFPKAFPESEAWVTEALSHLESASIRGVSEIAALLDGRGQREALDAALKRLVSNRGAGVDLLIWACRERDGLASGVFGIELAHALLDCLENLHVSSGPKRGGRLLEVFSTEEGLMDAFVVQPEGGSVLRFIKRLLATPAIEELTRRSLMARVIKQRPEYEQVMAERVTPKDDDVLLVSWDSLERRKAELQELVNVKIPHNKNEIQIAREEGDLRENGGYKAARDQQAVLNRMRDQLEREISRCRGTDFANVGTDVAGIGTVVMYEELSTGAKHRLTILGAWDSDLDRGIVSYLSDIAKALTGLAVGAEVDLPAESGSLRARVISIDSYAALQAAS